MGVISAFRHPLETGQMYAIILNHSKSKKKIIYFICESLNLSFFQAFETVKNSNYSKIFFFEDFISFYSELLNPFQEIEIEIQFEIIDNSNTISYINSISGFYEEAVKFKLLDESKIEFLETELQKLLSENFNLNDVLGIE